MTDLAHLFRYPNATVQYKSILSVPETHTGKLNPVLLAWLHQKPNDWKDIKLVLRKLESISDDEAKECFRLAFPYWDTYSSLDIRRSKVSIDIVSLESVVSSTKLSLLVTIQGTIVSGKTNRSGNMIGPARINVFALCDYLRSINIDLDGLLASGEAVEE